MTEEQRLIQHLLQKYDQVGTIGRPVHNISNTVTVYFQLILSQIMNLDETNQVLVTNLFNAYVSWSISLFGDTFVRYCAIRNTLLYITNVCLHLMGPFASSA